MKSPTIFKLEIRMPNQTKAEVVYEVRPGPNGNGTLDIFVSRPSKSIPPGLWNWLPNSTAEQAAAWVKRRATETYPKKSGYRHTEG